MGRTTAQQAEGVRDLVRESVSAVDAIAPSVLRKLAPAMRQARDELRRDLTDWLGKVGDPEDRFGAYQLQGALRSLEGSFDRIAELQPAMSKALGAARHETGPLAIANLDTEITRLSAIFGGGVPTIPDIPTAAIIAKGDKMLWKRHEASAARYAANVGDDVRHLFAVGAARGETFQQLTTRLLRTADPSTRISPIDPGRDGHAIGDALAQRAVTQADRLVRTELMHAYNVQHDESIKFADKNRIDGTPKYLRRWDAAADRNVCSICAGLDGKTAPINGSFPGGYSSPPAHPYCRCVVLAWSPEWGDLPGETQVTDEPKPEPEKKVTNDKKHAPENREDKPTKEPKQKRGPKPLPQLADTRRLSEHANAAMVAIQSGEHDEAVHQIGLALRSRGLVPSSVPNNRNVTVSDDGLKMKAHDGRDITALAFRRWDGSIQLSETTGKHLLEFARAADGKRADDLIPALNKLNNELYERRMTGPKAQRASVPQGDHARVGILSTRGDAVSTMVHETLHGFSPIESSAYRGFGGQIEELTTETMARVVTRDMFGVAMPSWNQGSYRKEIEAATRAISVSTGKTMEQSYELLGEAAERFKKRPQKYEHPDDVISAFATDIQHVTQAHPGRIMQALHNNLTEAAK